MPLQSMLRHGRIWPFVSGYRARGNEGTASASGGMFTISDKIAETAAPATGFDYLRILLSIAILWWHSIFISRGDTLIDVRIWSGPIRFLPALLVPMFFALSGFLVAGSLGRNPIHRFVTLRAIRIFPALAVEVILSGVVIGALFSVMDPIHYYMSHEFFAYLLNVCGIVHMTLPGVFSHNPSPGYMNGQLWTIPFEFECYAALVALSFTRIVANRKLFLIVVSAAALYYTVLAMTTSPISGLTHLPGRALVLSFLFGVLLYVFRDKAPYNDFAGVVAAVAAVVCLEASSLTFLAAIPVAYLTVWLGLKRPPAIRFGDLSYGIFLFHFPVLQVIVALSPFRLPWWALATLATPIAGLIAFASWTLVERPVLRRKQLFLSLADRVVEVAAFWKRSSEPLVSRSSS